MMVEMIRTSSFATMSLAFLSYEVRPAIPFRSRHTPCLRHCPRVWLAQANRLVSMSTGHMQVGAVNYCAAGHSTTKSDNSGTRNDKLSALLLSRAAFRALVTHDSISSPDCASDRGSLGLARNNGFSRSRISQSLRIRSWSCCLFALIES